ncbi:hypothetical protein IGI46_005137, partial [Enterococcus sp. AZ163]
VSVRRLANQSAHRFPTARAIQQVNRAATVEVRQ